MGAVKIHVSFLLQVYQAGLDRIIDSAIDFHSYSFDTMILKKKDHGLLHVQEKIRILSYNYCMVLLL